MIAPFWMEAAELGRHGLQRRCAVFREPAGGTGELETL